ncbi:MAG: outer membrane beta-barrel protein [Vicinamibacterales bacterium]
MNGKRIAMAVAIAVVSLTPTAARADVLLTPFAGITFGGSGDSTGTFGAGLAFMGAGIFGFEAEVAYTPSFFDSADFEFIDSDNAVSVMGNLILGAPIGGTEGKGVRPYATVGVGMLKTNVNSSNPLFGNVSNTDFGVNAGAGVMAFFSDHVGIRGDMRYFRALTDPQEDNEFDIDFGGLHFWRGYVGLTFKF